jgi:hypothetical protein
VGFDEVRWLPVYFAELLGTFGRCCFERFRLQLSVLFQQDFHLAFGLFQFLAATVGKLNAFFKQFERLFESDIASLQFIHDFLKPLQAVFELRQTQTPLRLILLQIQLGSSL